MGNGVSGMDDVEKSLVKDAKKALNGLEDEQAAELATNQLQSLIDAANEIEDEDEGPDFAVLFIKRSAGLAKMVEYGKKNKAQERFKKLKKKDATVIMLKSNEVYKNKIHSNDIRKVAFLLGAAFGKGWSNLGPMADADSEWCVFPEADEDDEEEDADGDDSDDEDEDDFVLIKCAPEDGIRIKEFKKKKKAFKKHNKLEDKGCMNIVVHGGKVLKHTDAGNEKQRAQVCFMIGCAFGRDLLSEDLGPVTEDGHELEILEEHDADDSDEED